ncbi:MAG TPA: hypothetical protein DEA08_13670 [Planctomycetes bacterium]|nr:hypothetical protein [Planctomycetota bacterium]
MKRRGWILAGTYLGAGALALSLSSGSAAAADVPPQVQQKLRELDANGDGKLQPSEVPFPAEAFARGDKDGDGALSYREAYLLHLFEEAKKKVKRPVEAMKRFRQADKDQDGKVSRAEFPGPEQLWVRMDKDGDGYVTHDEGLRYSIEEELAEAFAKHDRDLSGSLSKEELPKDAQAFFAAADADEDGELSGEEAFAFVYSVRKAAFAQNATPSAAPKAQPATKAPAAGKLGVLAPLLTHFAQLDADHDGKLSPAEAYLSPELFERLDADRDGSVDPDEVQLRLGYAKRIGARGEQLKQRVKAAGLEQALRAYATELAGLFAAGRYEEVSKRVDLLELRLRRLEAKRTQ